jgi:type I restriction enzyme S subunit
LLLPRYLNQFLHSSIYWNWVKANLKPGAQPNINSPQYQSIKIPLVNVKRQEEVADILEEFDHKLDLLIIQKRQLELLNKGLRQKLLSGEWRINLNKVIEE